MLLLLLFKPKGFAVPSSIDMAHQIQTMLFLFAQAKFLNSHHSFGKERALQKVIMTSVNPIAKIKDLCLFKKYF